MYNGNVRLFECEIMSYNPIQVNRQRLMCPLYAKLTGIGDIILLSA